MKLPAKTIMKSQRGAVSHSNAKRLLAPALPLCCLLVLTSLSCSKQSKTYRPGDPWKDQGSMGSGTGFGGQSRSAGESPMEPRNWSYASMPSPPLNGKPSRLLRSVGFADGSSTLDREATAALRSLSDDMQRNAGMRIVVVGFADGAGEKAQGDALGMKRAETVKDMLVRSGISADRIEVSSFGSSLSTAPASDRVAQELERKGEIWKVAG